jgi:hypothetical protein
MKTQSVAIGLGLAVVAISLAFSQSRPTAAQSQPGTTFSISAVQACPTCYAQTPAQTTTVGVWVVRNTGQSAQVAYCLESIRELTVPQCSAWQPMKQ